MTEGGRLWGEGGHRRAERRSVVFLRDREGRQRKEAHKQGALFRTITNKQEKRGRGSGLGVWGGRAIVSGRRRRRGRLVDRIPRRRV